MAMWMQNSSRLSSSIFRVGLFRIQSKHYHRSRAVLARFSCDHDQGILKENNGLGFPGTCVVGPPTYKILAHPKRFFSTSPRASSPLLKFASKEEPSRDKLIYNGPLSTMVRLIKFFSLSTSIVSSGLLAVLFMSGEGGIMTIVATGMSSIMICTPIVLHWFTKGYITRLYYDFPTKTYTACTYDFFLTDVKTDFKKMDVSLPNVSSVVSSFAIRGKPVLVDPRGFSNPNHYTSLMGYTDVEGNVTFEEAKEAFESMPKDAESKT